MAYTFIDNFGPQHGLTLADLASELLTHDGREYRMHALPLIDDHPFEARWVLQQRHQVAGRDWQDLPATSAKTCPRDAFLDVVQDVVDAKGWLLNPPEVMTDEEYEAMRREEV